jgi:hypothetical protein
VRVAADSKDPFAAVRGLLGRTKINNSTADTRGQARTKTTITIN